MTRDFSEPENFLNRELSWLEFNQRVLEEAHDPDAVRCWSGVKFFCIFSSNLDEFFEVRVAGIKQQIESGIERHGADGLTPRGAFQAPSAKRVRQMVADAIRLLAEGHCCPRSRRNGIRFLEV